MARSESPAGTLCSPPALRLPALPPNIEQGSSDAAPQNHHYPALLPEGQEPPPGFSTRSSDRPPNMSSRRETVETNDYGDTPVFTLLPGLAQPPLGGDDAGMGSARQGTPRQLARSRSRPLAMVERTGKPVAICTGLLHQKYAVFSARQFGCGSSLRDSRLPRLVLRQQRVEKTLTVIETRRLEPREGSGKIDKALARREVEQPNVPVTAKPRCRAAVTPS